MELQADKNPFLDWHGCANLHLCGAVHLHGSYCRNIPVRTVWEEKLLRRSTSIIQLRLQLSNFWWCWLGGHLSFGEF